MERRHPYPDQAAVILAVLLITSLTYAQEDRKVQTKSLSLVLRLKSESSKVCLGAFVPLELEIANHTDVDLEIRQLDLWRHFSFDYVDQDGLKKSIHYGLWPGTTTEYERQKAGIHPLRAKNVHSTTHRFPLSDGRFFRQPIKYTLKVYYAANPENRSVFRLEAASNSVDFETYDCNSKVQGVINELNR